MKIRIKITLACLLWAYLPQLQAREVVLSEKPIALNLPVGKEVIIKFPESVTHSTVLNENSGEALNSLLTPDGVLYLTAAHTFEKTRMMTELVDGRIVMFDIQASGMGPFDGDLSIVRASAAPVSEPVATTAPAYPGQPVAGAIPKEKNPYKPDFLEDDAAKTLNIANGDFGGADSQTKQVGYHNMVQYGFRHYLGPARLIGENLGKVVSVSKNDVSATLLRMNDGRLTVKPLKQWVIDDYYLTVLLVNNRSASAVEFDPRSIRGRWVFAAALYPVLEPRGNRFDQTLWALISQVPFDKARK
ncbi:MAG: DUF3438 family protein [Cardiobacteriaceae bacterium]|nr:DUF3438 family protein [Cardiobacteriaceae bacterium]